MDTQAIATRVFDCNGWRYDVDPIRGEIQISLTGEIDGQRYPIHCQLIPGASSILLRARAIAGSGIGQDCTPIAAIVAMMSYDLDVQLGVDSRDGEIEARAEVSFACVDSDYCSQVFEAAWRRFLRKCLRVTDLITGILNDDREDSATSVAPSVDLDRQIPPSA